MRRLFGERGQTSVDYLGMLVMVTGVLGALALAAPRIGSLIGDVIEAQVCEIAGGRCGHRDADEQSEPTAVLRDTSADHQGDVVDVNDDGTFASIASDYLRGDVLPSADFPYRPEIRDTDAGRRAADPYGECSWLTDRTLSYDLRDACDTHDYGYDLIRAGVLDRNAKAAIDYQFLRDMLADCQSRHGIFGDQCAPVAFVAYAAVVSIGDPQEGQPIRQSCSWWEFC